MKKCKSKEKIMKIVAMGGGENGRPGKPYEVKKFDEKVVEMTGKESSNLLFIAFTQKSAEGAEMIKALAGTITGKSQKSVELANDVRKIIVEEQAGIEKTQQKYEELSSEIDESVAEIKAIAEKAEHLTEYKEKVIGNVQDLSAISQETAARMRPCM